MRILHLAYEDPIQPGSGGGSIRAREINRRLADRHEITALVAGYPGAKPRVEDGVRWVPTGTHTGTKLDRLSYFSLLGMEVTRRSHDLVVEEFGAPFSVGLSPLFTKKPIVASVQWLFASQMRDKYRLPFDQVEKHGLRFYDRFIAVSDWLAEDLRARRPGANVETIPNGVEEIAYEAQTMTPKHLLFIGRLDIAHKGGDFLFEVFARIGRMRGGHVPPLVIVGDGPDRRAMERLAEESGLSHLVKFRGRVEGPEKYRLMAAAHAVLMPSRHETFGMVAVEALAAGIPLIAFDVGPLREVTGFGSETGARLVPPFDLDAFAGEVVRLVDNPMLAGPLREAGRRWARRYDWDEIVARQEECYLRAVSGEPSRITGADSERPLSARTGGRPAATSAPRFWRHLGSSLLSQIEKRVAMRKIGQMRWKRHYRSVALVGVDGSGKSTQAERLRRLLVERNGARVFAVHAFGRKLVRVGISSPVFTAPSETGQLRRNPGALRRIVAAVDILDIALYLWFVRVRVVLATLFGDREVWLVGDRSLDDVLIKHLRRGTISKRTVALVRRLVPRFETTIWLETEPSIAMARDKDFDLSYYEELHAEYSAAAQRFGWKVTRGPGRPVESVFAAITEELGLEMPDPNTRRPPRMIS